MVDKKVFSTTDIFKNKNLPPFLRNNPLFTTESLPIVKVFPTIGIHNFKQETNIVKCMVDIKKEGGYVWNLLQDISVECGKAKELIGTSSQKTQFLAPMEERLAKKAKLNEVAQVIIALTVLAENCDPRSAHAFHPTNGIVSLNGGKVDLRLHTNILNGEGKIIHKAGLPIFRLYKQLRDKCIEHGVDERLIFLLDAMESYKIFSKENIPNKKYQIIFSSEGQEGAWDIMTMSMRGTRSCQRWDGEYPKCLIGSVLSKFVGIIYLTSGVAAEPFGEFGVLGSKMMRRCIVRYAYDRDNDTPCLIMDKMYPSEDEEIIKSFMDTLSEKAKAHSEFRNAKNPRLKVKPIPVYYGPRLANKTRHIYIPNEPISAKISMREKSYQDTALRTKCEVDANLITNNQSEIDRYSQKIQSNFSSFLSSRFEDIEYNNIALADSEVKNIVKNLTLSGPFSLISDAFAQAIFTGLTAPKSNEYYSTKSYNRDYLKALFVQRKHLIFYSKTRIDNVLKTYCSREYNLESFSKYLLNMIVEFVKKEISILNR